MKIGIPVLAVCVMAAGCGRSATSSAPSGNPQPQALAGPAKLRAKLNAMSVSERLAYLKQHPGAATQSMGVGGPMGGPGGSRGPVMSSSPGQKGP